MKMIMKKTFNLKETLEELLGTTMYNPYIIDFSIVFKNYLNNEVPNGLDPDQIKFASFDEEEFTYLDYVAEFLNEFYNRYYKYTSISIYSDDELNDALDDFRIRFLNALNLTYPKYKILVKLYKDNESNLLKGLTRTYSDESATSGSSNNRFNDTPQNGGDYSDDPHTSSINQIDTAAESNLEHVEEYNNEYLIDRLNKVRDNLSNIFAKWENEVARILWLEAYHG
mgnify:CR=1 FL=1